MSRKVIGAATGPREGYVTVVCDDGAVFIGLRCADWPLNLESGQWDEATPIPGTERAADWTFASPKVEASR